MTDQPVQRRPSHPRPEQQPYRGSAADLEAPAAHGETGHRAPDGWTAVEPW